MDFIKTKDGKIIYLHNKCISSFEIVDKDTSVNELGNEDGFIAIYYYDENIGKYLERDGLGGHSMDNYYFNELTEDTMKQIIKENNYETK